MQDPAADIHRENVRGGRTKAYKKLVRLANVRWGDRSAVPTDFRTATRDMGIVIGFAIAAGGSNQKDNRESKGTQVS